jgi:hypothetical protein
MAFAISVQGSQKLLGKRDNRVCAYPFFFCVSPSESGYVISVLAQRMAHEKVLLLKRPVY